MAERRLSELYGMRVYTETGKEVGSVQDFIINLEEGKISRFTLDPIATASKEEAVMILKKRSVYYENVKSVGDVIIISPSNKKED